VTVRVTLQNPHQLKDIPQKKQFQHWLNAVFAHKNFCKIPCEEITIRIVNKEESAELNKNFRGKTGPTNVLSFSYEPLSELDSLGDLAICKDIVCEEAITQEKDVFAHWAHLSIHGTLHLLGYDHVKEQEAVVMENLEKEILLALGYPNPYELHSSLTHES
jgi:probable rRNA maturation factor